MRRSTSLKGGVVEGSVLSAYAGTSIRLSKGGILKGGRPTILLAEDEPSLRSALTRALSQAGFEVMPAASGAEALVAAGAGRFDALITDVIMPGMSGRDLAQKVAAEYGVVPTIYMSGYSDDSLDDLAAHEFFITKPFSIATLIDSLRRVLLGEDEDESDPDVPEF